MHGWQSTNCSRKITKRHDNRCNVKRESVKGHDTRDAVTFAERPCTAEVLNPSLRMTVRRSALCTGLVSEAVNKLLSFVSAAL
jgi:hypothetical protein